MLDPGQEGTLARTHAGKPGLPRGRNRLPALAVQASQRERLLRATIAAVAQKGYPAVTVADIVHLAKVSRAAFYLHFRSREDCFLAATRAGGQLLLERVLEAARAVPADASDEETLRAGCRGFLQFLADEPAFARVFYIDMPAAGPAAVDRLQAASIRYAEINAKWHRRARARHPDWPAVPAQAYQALAGATLELVRSQVSADKTDSLPELEDTVVALHLAVLAGRRWPDGRCLTGCAAGSPSAGEVMQAAVDKSGGAADVGADQFAERGGSGGAVQVLAQAVSLDPPQPEQCPGGDLRFRVIRGQPGPCRQDPGGGRDGLVHHVGLVGPQRGRGPDQVTEPADRLAPVAALLFTRQPAGHLG